MVIMPDYHEAGDPVSRTTIIYAPEHKTSMSGPAPILMSKTLSKKMSTYIKHVRTIFNLDEALLLTESGKQFEKGMKGRRILEFWAKTNVRSDIKITATRMCKMAATTTMNNMERNKRLMHQHVTRRRQKNARI